jgi:nucleotide-binding universal stress UspA family protein
MTVVVGYIPNQHGEAALTAGLAEARLRGSDLLVVNATRGDSLIDKKYLGDSGVADLEQRLSAENDLSTSVRQAMGPDVAAEIVRVATEVDAELLVIGLRRRTPVGKMIMGSVAQQVLIDAPCPVLAVKAG